METVDISTVHDIRDSDAYSAVHWHRCSSCCVCSGCNNHHTQLLRVSVLGCRLYEWKCGCCMADTGVVNEILGNIPLDQVLQQLHQHHSQCSMTAMRYWGMSLCLVLLHPRLRQPEEFSLGAESDINMFSVGSEDVIILCSPLAQMAGQQPWPPPVQLKLMHDRAALRPGPTWPSFSKFQDIPAGQCYNLLQRPPCPHTFCGDVRIGSLSCEDLFMGSFSLFLVFCFELSGSSVLGPMVVNACMLSTNGGLSVQPNITKNGIFFDDGGFGMHMANVCCFLQDPFEMLPIWELLQELGEKSFNFDVAACLSAMPESWCYEELRKVVTLREIWCHFLFLSSRRYNSFGLVPLKTMRHTTVLWSSFPVHDMVANIEMEFLRSNGAPIIGAAQLGENVYGGLLFYLPSIPTSAQLCSEFIVEWFSYHSSEGHQLLCLLQEWKIFKYSIAKYCRSSAIASQQLPAKCPAIQPWLLEHARVGLNLYAVGAQAITDFDAFAFMLYLNVLLLRSKSSCVKMDLFQMLSIWALLGENGLFHAHFDWCTDQSPLMQQKHGDWLSVCTIQHLVVACLIRTGLPWNATCGIELQPWPPLQIYSTNASSEFFEISSVASKLNILDRVLMAKVQPSSICDGNKLRTQPWFSFHFGYYLDTNQFLRQVSRAEFYFRCLNSIGTTMLAPASMASGFSVSGDKNLSWPHGRLDEMLCTRTSMVSYYKSIEAQNTCHITLEN